MGALVKIGQLIFIRHGEKVSDDFPGLANQGKFRADNLYRVFGRGNAPAGKFNTPDVIYAMRKGKEATSSTRPFDTVAPLGKSLGMEPVMGERTGQHGQGVFDAKYRKKDTEELYESVKEHADGSYKGKTVLFCWEHQTIPDIVETFGLNPYSDPLHWGSDPTTPDDEPTNFTAIWVINPGLKKHDPDYFKVYSEFNIVPNQVDGKGHIPEQVDQQNALFTADEPTGGYGNPVFTANP